MIHICPYQSVLIHICHYPYLCFWYFPRPWYAWFVDPICPCQSMSIHICPYLTFIAYVLSRHALPFWACQPVFMLDKSVLWHGWREQPPKGPYGMHLAMLCELWLVKLRLLDLKHWHDWSQYSKHQTCSNLRELAKQVDLVNLKFGKSLKSFESVQVASSPVEARNGTRCSSPPPKRRRNRADSRAVYAVTSRWAKHRITASWLKFAVPSPCPSMPWDQR